MRHVIIVLVLASFFYGNTSCETAPYPIETREEALESNDFWIATMDSTEQRWGYWFGSYETEAAFEAVLTHDPPVDFVVVTGDITACNPDHPAKATGCYLEFQGAFAHYLPGVKMYYIGGNHDIAGTTPIPTWPRTYWEDLVGPLHQEFWHRGAHFVLVSDGDCQDMPFWEKHAEEYNWYCSVITPTTLSFRHMVKVGYYEPPSLMARYECEIGVVPYVFYGHYGQTEDVAYGGTHYVQTADAKEGFVRFVHVVDGVVVETEVSGP